MRYKVLKFWAKLYKDHPLTPKGDFFKKNDCYFCLLQIPHHNTIMIKKKIIKADHQMQGYIIFGQIGQRHFWRGGKLTIVTFVNILCLIILNV